jgi:hypothetical protein
LGALLSCMSGASLGKAPIFMIRKLTLEKQQYRQLKTKHVVIDLLQAAG